MNPLIKNAIALAILAIAAQASAQVTFYEHDGFQGRSFTAERPIRNFERFGFNDRASSVEVLRQRWEVCEDARFSGRCVILRPGRYPSLAAMGLNNRISSVRDVGRDARIDDGRYAPLADERYRRHDNERLHQAQVTSVRAVVGPPEQRCWVEREQVAEDRGTANVPGAIAGAVIGGILGHQIGSGRSQDIVTVGGAVAGAAIGANVGRDGQPARTQEVQRCTTTPGQVRPNFWDVAYNFRGEEHRVQMTSPPGASVTVNERGEPRE